MLTLIRENIELRFSDRTWSCCRYSANHNAIEDKSLPHWWPIKWLKLEIFGCFYTLLIDKVVFKAIVYVAHLRFFPHTFFFVRAVSSLPLFLSQAFVLKCTSAAVLFKARYAESRYPTILKKTTYNLHVLILPEQFVRYFPSDQCGELKQTVLFGLLKSWFIIINESYFLLFRDPLALTQT